MTALPTRPSTQSGAVKPQICMAGREFAGSLNQLRRTSRSFIRRRRVAPQPSQPRGAGAAAAPPRLGRGRPISVGGRGGAGAAVAVVCRDERRASGGGHDVALPGCAGVAAGATRANPGAAPTASRGAAPLLVAATDYTRAPAALRSHPGGDLLNATLEAIRLDHDDSRTHHMPDMTASGRLGSTVVLCRSAAAPARGRCRTQQSGHIPTR